MNLSKSLIVLFIIFDLLSFLSGLLVGVYLL